MCMLWVSSPMNCWPSERPFGGPDYRHQHLLESPPTITGIPDRLQSLVIECLYKSPGARPRPENLLTRLKDSFKPTSPAGSRLQQGERSGCGKTG